MTQAWLEIRQATRALRRTPTFTTVAVLTLAIGIGATTAIFSVVNGVLLNPLPYHEPGKLVSVSPIVATFGRLGASAPELRDIRERTRSLSAIGATRLIVANLTGGSTPEHLNGAFVSPDFFSVLGVSPELGRDFTQEDAVGGISYTMIISHRLWQQQLGADPEVVGRVLRVDDDPITVIGVMPASYSHPFESAAAPSDFWITIDLEAGSRWDQRQQRNLQLIGRLDESSDLNTARAELARIAEEIRTTTPGAYPGTSPWTIETEPLLDRIVGNTGDVLALLIGSVAFVLIVACTNVANLLLTRWTGRSKETAIRTAMGGSRSQVVRAMLAESATLGVLGGGLGLLVAVGGTSLLESVIAGSLPRVTEVSIDLRVLAFTFVLAAGTGVAFGLLPAITTSRVDLRRVLESGARGSSAAQSRMGAAFVVVQIAVSLVLLSGSGLMFRTLNNLMNVDMGFDPAGVLTARTKLPWPNDPSQGRYTQQDAILSFYNRVQDALAEMPGVAAVGITTGLPLSGGGRVPLQVVGSQVDQSGQPPLVSFRGVNAGFFDVMRIPLFSGRTFTTGDDLTSEPVAIINQALADAHFPNENPVGRQIIVLGRPRTVIGVVGNIRQQALEAEPQPEVYTHYRQGAPNDMTHVIRTSLDPVALARPTVAAVQSVDPNEPVAALRPMSEIVEQSVVQRSLVLKLISLFAFQALFLAGIGVYGVISYTVRQRTREIGIRMALGALPGRVTGLVVRGGLVLGAVGVVLGLAGSLLLTRFLASMLYGVGRNDPVTLAGVAFLSVAVTGAAALLPALRAARVDPAVTLREE